MNSDFISEVILNISESIKTGIFQDQENGKVELKDLSTNGEWRSLKETVCAYLNTDGGFIVCGVRERKTDNRKSYTLTGFNRDNEGKIIEIQTRCVKDDNGLFVDVSDNIFFDYGLILDSEILIIVVVPLSDDKKYVSFDGKYYERKLTQDKEILSAKLQKQREYKAELEYAKELTVVAGAEMKDLSLDKVNKYVDLLNREIRKESLKPSLSKAKEFLSKRNFIDNERITTLGMLVCGDDPFHFLNARVEVDCYYDTSSDIGKDKKIFRNDVINLMEDSFRYIWGHIKISRVVKEGGKSEPEYPETMIRETINNALAHRDYTIDNFVTVTVEPNRYIEIKNPGSFKEKMKLLHTGSEIEVRRIIPGIPESKNPKLASVLKVFDKIESQGRGMASLVNTALENLVDLPYYEIKDKFISLKIPTGKLVDTEIESWLSGFEQYITGKLKRLLTDEHKAVLAYFYKSELLNKRRCYTILLTESNNHFLVLEQLKNAGLIYEHQVSTEESPVFVLDRVLMKTTFAEIFLQIIGSDYISYDQVAKELLDIIYLHTKYNTGGLKASDITPEIYRRLHGKTIIAKTYESLGRKVRGICKTFEAESIFIKGEKNEYRFNDKYNKGNSLFND